ncbi:MAG TPA: protein-export chaperone SecB [Gammaproteobacteria bacterium]|jgi:preprotein translocase subunit SecB|nr:protein-export chaperone SecB [Gammaproteobacteria bacterium]
MAENDNPQQKTVLLSRIYVKDCSFESPRSPEVFASPMSPQLDVSMRTASKKISGNEVEVVLTVTVEATSDGRSLFLIEVHQAGLFAVSGFAEAEEKAILGSYCPGILFPYAREVVSDLVMKGGMPALLLQPVNFDAVYAQSLAEAGAAK